MQRKHFEGASSEPPGESDVSAHSACSKKQLTSVSEARGRKKKCHQDEIKQIDTSVGKKKGARGTDARSG